MPAAGFSRVEAGLMTTSGQPAAYYRQVSVFLLESGDLEMEDGIKKQFPAHPVGLEEPKGRSTPRCAGENDWRKRIGVEPTNDLSTVHWF